MKKIKNKMNEKLTEFLREKRIEFALRESIKISIDGNRDKSRKTYCFGNLRDEELKKILDLMSENERAKKYIMRRNNDNSSFILGIDLNSVRFYLDFGFRNNRVSMISVEIKNETFNVKEYIPTKFDYEISPYFDKVLDYVDLNSYLIRSDGQRYLRFVKNIPLHILDYYCPDEPFFGTVGNPVWFQFSEDAFTFYFQSKINEDQPMGDA